MGIYFTRYSTQAQDGVPMLLSTRFPPFSSRRRLPPRTRIFITTQALIRGRSHAHYGTTIVLVGRVEGHLRSHNNWRAPFCLLLKNAPNGPIRVKRARSSWRLKLRVVTPKTRSLNCI